MTTWRPTRRKFLSSAAAAAAAALAGGCPRPASKGIVVYKRSGKGLHVSRAAKNQNANRLYKTKAAALGDAPHPGDNSKVVTVTISRAAFDRYFAKGRTIFDFRRDL